MEQQPESFARINFEGEAVEANRLNTVVYQHLGQAALYDHVFITHPNKEYGAYIWANQPPENPNFIALVGEAVSHQCEIHVNIQRVAPNDVKAFEKACIRAADEEINGLEGIPEGWE